jgi:hypothetical protein
MTVYIGESMIRRALVVLEQQLESDQGSRCLGCGEPEPCLARTDAYVSFQVMGILPRRRRNRFTERGGGWFAPRGFGQPEA